MARTRLDSCKIRPYTFIPQSPRQNSQESPPISSASTGVPNEPIHTTAYLEQDPEVLRTAQILVNIYQQETSCLSARNAQVIAVERPLTYAHDVHIFAGELTSLERNEYEDFEILASPTKMVADRVTKRKTTRGKAVTKKPLQKKTQPARKPVKRQDRHKDKDRDRESLESPVLTVTHNSHAKKSRRKQRVSAGEEDDGDTIDVEWSVAYDEVQDSDSDYVDQVCTQPRLRPLLLDRSCSDAPTHQISRNSKPAGYATPLSPSMSPMSRTSSRSTTCVVQESPAKPAVQALNTSSRATAVNLTDPSSVSSLRRFSDEARREQSHRRTESLESSGFLEKVRTAHEALHLESDEEEEEEEHMETEMAVDVGDASLVDEADTNEDESLEEEDGRDEMNLEDLVPSFNAERDGDEREEDDMSDDGSVSFPPQPQH